MWLSLEGYCGPITSLLCLVMSDLVDRGEPLSLPFDAFQFLPCAIFVWDVGVRRVIPFWLSGASVFFAFFHQEGFVFCFPLILIRLLGINILPSCDLAALDCAAVFGIDSPPFPLPASLLFDW